MLNINASVFFYLVWMVASYNKITECYFLKHLFNDNFVKAEIRTLL